MVLSTTSPTSRHRQKSGFSVENKVYRGIFSLVLFYLLEKGWPFFLSFFFAECVLWRLASLSVLIEWEGQKSVLELRYGNLQTAGWNWVILKCESLFWECDSLFRACLESVKTPLESMKGCLVDVNICLMVMKACFESVNVCFVWKLVLGVWKTVRRVWRLICRVGKLALREWKPALCAWNWKPVLRMEACSEDGSLFWEWKACFECIEACLECVRAYMYGVDLFGGCEGLIWMA